MTDSVDLAAESIKARAAEREQKQAEAHVAAQIRTFKGIYSRPTLITLAKLGLAETERLLAEKEPK